MSSNNFRRNKAEIEKFQKQLKEMCDDIAEIDVKILRKSVGVGLANAKKNTPVDTGHMRRSWKMSAKKVSGGAQAALFNIVDYSSYVNYGYRIVTKGGKTVGFVKGWFILERACSLVEKQMVKEFEKEVERINKKYDK